jgi:hypothetical protein
MSQEKLRVAKENQTKLRESTDSHDKSIKENQK